MAARTSHSEETALSLTLAVVASSPGPLLLLDGELKVVAASASFLDAFELPPTATGRSLFSLGSGEWAVPQLRELLEATLAGAPSIDTYEMDLQRPKRATRRLVILAQRLVYLDLENRRLLVAVSDVTDARADQNLKDDRLRQNLVLLQEVRHRVSNSLQIIASVLLQNAKTTRSDETRGHLKDAHDRVMSVAALERQLAGSGAATVEVQNYFSQLCESIAASMIGENHPISLTVTGGGGVADARVAVSLGLIVTELVINALKHAFPDGRAGHIIVDCAFQGPNWRLSVNDDGVGIPTDPAEVRTGLGATIVEALASQLEASIEISSAYPGTQVAITHVQIALVLDDDDDAAAADTEQDAAANL